MPASTSTTERHDQPARLHPCAGPGRSPATIARPAATRQRSTRPSRPGVQRGGFLAVATSTITHRMRDKVYVTNSWQSSRTCPVCIIVTLCMGQNLFFFSIVQTSDIALRILLSSVPLGLPLWALLSAFSRLLSIPLGLSRDKIWQEKHFLCLVQIEINLCTLLSICTKHRKSFSRQIFSRDKPSGIDNTRVMV